MKPKAITNPNQSRYFFNNVLAGKYFSLPTVGIKKTDFVNIGKNKYIKPGNIGRISQENINMRICQLRKLR
ncbi:hypothetical protein ABVC55_12655 [Lactobacillus crispatus]|uniref:hypothetical protein n=1 Tax=Lactobacillus crispatus TaxID=47770 RepID=UPI00336A3231